MAQSRRERFKETMEHRTPERLVLDLGGCPLSGIAAKPRAALMDLLGLDPDPAYTSDANSTRLDERLLRALDIDTRAVGEILFPQSEQAGRVSDVETIDPWGVRRRFTGRHWDIVYSPLANATAEDLEAYPWPDPESIDTARIERFGEVARKLYEETDYVICGEHPIFGVLEMGCWVCGYETFLTQMIAEPDFVLRFFDHVFEFQRRVIELYYPVVGPYIHFTSSGDDFATQLASFISPAMFRRLIKPYMTERIQLTRKYTRAAFLHHSCGNVFHLIPDLIDCGVEILNPIQPCAPEMEAEGLKSAYGERIVFHGGIDTQEVLPRATPNEVEESTHDTIAVLAKDGGYVFAAAHEIQDDVPPENVIAAFRAAREFVPARS
ncbi:MAG: uroporphyrinogen decarboxylase family protein [Armatimonadota bacterium]|jgi:uroporphyrinogen decarboxylase